MCGVGYGGGVQHTHSPLTYIIIMQVEYHFELCELAMENAYTFLINMIFMLFTNLLFSIFHNNNYATLNKMRCTLNVIEIDNDNS